MKTVLGILTILCTALAIAAPGSTHYVSVRQAKIYQGPDADSEVVLTVAVGRKLMEFGRENGFVMVGVNKSGGIDGWIRVSDIADKDPDGLVW
jgi:hypothetical protein